MKGNCFACGYATEVTEYQMSPGATMPGPKKLCEVCANTFSGSAYEYPNQYPHRDVMFIVAWGINRILAEIRGEPFVNEYEDEAAADESSTDTLS